MHYTATHTETLLAANQWTKSSTLDPNGRPWHVSRSGNVLPVRVQARAQLIHLHANPRPYFSITGEVFNPRSRRAGGDGTITGGAIHETILHYWPQLAPLVEIHLSDDTGEPMHAAANAAYWSGLTKYQAADLDKLTRHLHVPRDVAADLMSWVHNYYGDNPEAYDNITTPTQAWAATLEDHKISQIYWQPQAAAALALLNKVAAQ